MKQITRHRPGVESCSCGIDDLERLRLIESIGKRGESAQMCIRTQRVADRLNAQMRTGL